MNKFDFNRANRNTKNESGWCERWAEQGFGFNGLYASAWASWQASSKRRGGLPPSDGNYYLVYFDGWWSGKHYGDIAVYRNGTVWSGSDPKWRSDTSFNTYKTWIGTAYLGWSEFLGNKRIATIGGTSVAKATAAQVTKAYKEILERNPDAGGLKHYTTNGMTEAQVRADLTNSKEHAALVARKIAQAKAKAAADAKARADAEAKAKAEAVKKAQEAAGKAAKEHQASQTDTLVAENNSLLKQILAILKKIFNIS